MELSQPSRSERVENTYDDPHEVTKYNDTEVKPTYLQVDSYDRGATATTAEVGHRNDAYVVADEEEKGEEEEEKEDQSTYL